MARPASRWSSCSTGWRTSTTCRRSTPTPTWARTPTPEASARPGHDPHPRHRPRLAAHRRRDHRRRRRGPGDPRAQRRAGAAGRGAFAARLKRLLVGLAEVIERWRPEEVAIEQVFMARNPDSALKLGQARGAALSAVVLRDLPVHEYAAREVKLAVVGKGGADKAQVQHMVGIMLNLHGKLQADAADALAIAITHAHVRATARRLG